MIAVQVSDQLATAANSYLKAFGHPVPDEIIEIGAGHATRYIGNYEDYLRSKAAETNGPARPPVAPAAARQRNRTVSDTPVRAVSDSKTVRAEQRRQRDVARIESEITDKESELAEVEEIINDPDFYQGHAEPHSVLSRFAQLKKEIDSLYGKLERLEQSQSPAEAQL